MKPALMLTLVLMVSGCCYLAPCHFGTEVIGHVYDGKNVPIENAKVTLYGYVVNTDSRGCFYLNKADALPFELTVEAQGYKTVRSDSQWGKFEVKVNLKSEGSPENGTISWEQKRDEVPDCA